MRILLDAMGGDNSPVEAIKGAVKAVEEIDSEIILIGNEEKICKIINSIIKSKRFNIAIQINNFIVFPSSKQC